MMTVNSYLRPETTDQRHTLTTFPLMIEMRTDPELDGLLANLSPDTPWGERQIAARKLGHMRAPQALEGLLNALYTDPFWMVRCAIIQALEMIGDDKAIPTLKDIARNDGFRVVRSYAGTAIERLSQAV